jgi:alpha-L-fucosidase 2
VYGSTCSKGKDSMNKSNFSIPFGNISIKALDRLTLKEFWVRFMPWIKFLFLLFICSIPASAAQYDIWENYKLWYCRPALEWHEALPVGNGRLGAMVFGGAVNERIQLNDDTIWAGPPVPRAREGFSQAMDEARKLWFDGKYVEAEEKIASVMGPRISPRSYQTMGDLHLKLINVSDDADISNYNRQLNLDMAEAETTFSIDGINYTRRVFCSQPDQVIVVRICVDKPGKLSLEALLERPADYTLDCSDGAIDMFGQAQHNGSQLGVKWHCRLQAVAQGSRGRIEYEKNTLRVQNADSVTFLIASSTDYNNNDPSNPLKHDRRQECERTIAAAMKKKYHQLRSDNIADHQGLFRRCSLDLGGWDKSMYPTDERLEEIKAGEVDPALVSLYFQYGRYLLICSSRAGNMAANLQGLWADGLELPWNSDYHININLQMNYWPAEVTGLSECHEPFFDFTRNLLPNAQKMAGEVFGCRGAAAQHATDAWLFAQPFSRTQWGMWPHGFGWCSQHFMEHYRFTQDKEFLEKEAWQILKNASLFYLDYLVVHPETGRLVSGLDNSPENTYLTPKGEKVYISMGCAMSQQVIWDVFTNTLEAAEILNIDDGCTKRLRRGYFGLFA